MKGDGERRATAYDRSGVAALVASAENARNIEQYRSLVRSIPGGFVLLFDPVLRFTVADGAALAAFGYRPDELEGRTPAQAFPPALAAELEPRYRAALGGVSTSWDRVVADAVYRLTAGPVRDADGQVFAGTVICLDVTAERRSEATARALQRIATAVANKAPVREVVHLVAAELHEIFRVDQAAVIRLHRPDRAQALAITPPPPSFRAGATFAAAEAGAAAGVLRTGTPSIIRCGAEDRSGACLLYDSARSAGAAAPVQVRGELWGAIAVASRDDHAISEILLERLSSFAQLVEIAISNAEAWDALSAAANSDSLTGLPNRRAFHDVLSREVDRARRHRRPLTVAIMDLDRFKDVNDTHGHPAGDRVLVEAARRLAGVTRSRETVARIGGEEFAWLMPETDAAGGVTAAERARLAIAAAPFPEIGYVSLSAGVCSLSDATDAETLMHQADRALYCAKAAGRNTTVRHIRAGLRAGDA